MNISFAPSLHNQRVLRRELLEAWIHNVIYHLHVGGECFELSDEEFGILYDCFRAFQQISLRHLDFKHPLRPHFSRFDIGYLSECFLAVEGIRQAIQKSKWGA